MGKISLKIRIALITLSLIAACGCVSEQHSEFRGSVTRGDGAEAPAPDGLHELGGQFSRAFEGAPDGLIGFSLGVPASGSIVFVFDQAAVARHGSRLNNASVAAVYYVEDTPWRQEFWEDFLRRDEQGRAAVAGSTACAASVTSSDIAATLISAFDWI